MELVVEIVRCFASMAVYDPRADRFDITGVMGPDEFHDGYPDQPGSRGSQQRLHQHLAGLDPEADHPHC